MALEMKHIFGTILVLLLAGCAVTRPRPEIDPGTLDRDSYLSWLADQPMVSAGEAYRAMLIAATDKDPGADFEANQREVFRRQIARPEWKLQADQAIDKATAAFMAVQVAEMPGGINLNLWGRTLHVSDRRFAYREIVWQGMAWGESPPYQVLTGGEMVSLLTWMDRRGDKGGELELPRQASSGAVASRPK
jgi:hypothetical protein